MTEATTAQLMRYVLGGSFALAFIFGAVGNKTNFCTMGAVSDWVNMGETGRMRMWLLAMAVAILGAFRVGVLEKASVVLPVGQDLPSLLSGPLGASKQCSLRCCRWRLHWA